MVEASATLAGYYESLARRQEGKLPDGYGYQSDVELGVGFFQDTKTGVKVLEKPVIIPSGKKFNQGYIVLFAYCQKQGCVSLLEGQIPPMMPATRKEPHEFMSKAGIASNFGAKDPAAAAENSAYCVALRVPAELANQAEVENRDIWVVRFDQDVVSPFLQAAKEGNAAELAKGLGAGLPAAMYDEDGITALMMAAMSGNVEACGVLMRGGADVNEAECTNSRTPLMFAAQGGHTALVSDFLSKGADATKADTDGSTALMWAALAGKVETVNVLKGAAGAAATNGEGMNALAIAEKVGHVEVIAALR